MLTYDKEERRQISIRLHDVKPQNSVIKSDSNIQSRIWRNSNCLQNKTDAVQRLSETVFSRIRRKDITAIAPNSYLSVDL
jgi:glucose-6-phosphate-specific signal transduction histidine kinase